MAGKQPGDPATHFGRQMKKERLARGWSLDEFSRRTGVNAGHLSRIENGKRPPTQALADLCDTAFPERRGWFREYYEESRTWTPPWFRNWPEYEDKSDTLRVWMPGIIHGLLQAEDYARALLATLPEVTSDMIASRLAARMERQRRVLLREDPPAVWFIVDELALYRCIGSAAVMAAQTRHLADVAARPKVTMQVLPAVAHSANASEFIVTGDAAYAEHVVGGFAYTDAETVTVLAARFDTLRGECYRVSESAALIERMHERWATGVSPLTQTPTAAPA